MTIFVSIAVLGRLNGPDPVRLASFDVQHEPSLPFEELREDSPETVRAFLTRSFQASKFCGEEPGN